MGTRARIARDNGDGTVTSIYSHWDGYPDYLGKMLIEHYTEPAKIDALIALGDVSQVRAEVAAPEGVAHTFDKPQPNVTIAYGRDRDEKNVDCRTHAINDGDWEECNYLYTGGIWHYRGWGAKVWRPVVDVLKEGE